MKSKIRFRTLRIFWDEIFVFSDDSKNFERPYLKKLKIAKLIFIRFKTLCNFLDQKMKTALFEGGWGGLNVVN